MRTIRRATLEGLAFVAPEAAPPLAAVVVVHGMGQQIPFETLDRSSRGCGGSISKGCRRHRSSNAEVRMSRVGGVDLPRAELDVHDRRGTPHRVHLYEAYWAPSTEGNVTLRDVVGFLLDGARNGIANALSGRRFRRWMFGDWVYLSRQVAILSSLVFATLVLFTMILLNIVTTDPPRWMRAGLPAARRRCCPGSPNARQC